MKNTATLLTLLLAFALTCQAQSPYLDLNFNQTGFNRSDFNGGDEDPARILIQSDGKILVSGDVEFNNSENFLVARYNADGTLDTNFANSGFLPFDLAVNEEDVARGMVELANGKILIAGRMVDPSTTNSIMVLVRINPDGSTDNTFGVNGIRTHSLTGANLFLSNLLETPDGKFVRTGRINDFALAETAIARFNSDGTIDNTFGNNGMVLHNILHNFDIAADAVVTGSGSVITAGWVYNDQSFSNQPSLVKFNPSGAVDSSFGTNGYVLVPNFGTDDVYRHCVLSSSNDFFAAGIATPNAGNNDILVSKFDTTGTVDISFGNNGHVVLDYNGFNDRVDGLEIQSDGKLIVAFTAEGTANDEDIGVIRLNQDGSVDSTFGDNGWIIIDIDDDDDVEASALQSDGKVLIAGRTNDGGNNQDMFILRLWPLTSVGIDEYSSTPIKLYPNPVQEVLFVENLKPSTPIEIIAANGKVLRTLISRDRVQSIDLSEFANGIYFIRSEDRISKFVISH